MQVDIYCPFCGNRQGDWIDTAQTARLLGRDKRRIREWCMKGRFPGAQHVKVGRTIQWRIPASAIRPLIG